MTFSSLGSYTGHDVITYYILDIEQIRYNSSKFQVKNSFKTSWLFDIFEDVFMYTHETGEIFYKLIAIILKSLFEVVVHYQQKAY